MGCSGMTSVADQARLDQREAGQDPGRRLRVGDLEHEHGTRVTGAPRAGQGAARLLLAHRLGLERDEPLENSSGSPPAAGRQMTRNCTRAALAYGWKPDSVQRLNTSTRSAGQAPSQGMVPLGEVLEDFGGVRLDVVAGPQVERERHGLAVVLAEQRLDVRLEAHRLVGSGQRDRLLIVGGTSLRRAPRRAVRRDPSPTRAGVCRRPARSTPGRT